MLLYHCDVSINARRLRVCSLRPRKGFAGESLATVGEAQEVPQGIDMLGPYDSELGYQ